MFSPKPLTHIFIHSDDAFHKSTIGPLQYFSIWSFLLVQVFSDAEFSVFTFVDDATDTSWPLFQPYNTK